MSEIVCLRLGALTGTLTHCWLEYKLVHPYREQFNYQKPQNQVPLDSGISIWGDLSHRRSFIHVKWCKLLTSELFIMVNIVWKQPKYVTKGYITCWIELRNRLKNWKKRLRIFQKAGKNKKIKNYKSKLKDMEDSCANVNIQKGRNGAQKMKK